MHMLSMKQRGKQGRKVWRKQKFPLLSMHASARTHTHTLHLFPTHLSHTYTLIKWLKYICGHYHDGWAQNCFNKIIVLQHTIREEIYHANTLFKADSGKKKTQG